MRKKDVGALQESHQLLWMKRVGVMRMAYKITVRCHKFITKQQRHHIVLHNTLPQRIWMVQCACYMLYDTPRACKMKSWRKFALSVTTTCVLTDTVTYCGYQFPHMVTKLNQELNREPARFLFNYYLSISSQCMILSAILVTFLYQVTINSSTVK